VSGCSKKPPEAVSFKANSPIPVGFTLLKAEGQVGRSGAISNNYRPQVRFPRGSVETTCAVVLPASSPALEPGQTTDASLACDSQIEVEPSQREFTVFEGGKQVAQGTVRLP
jgi:translation elongation factor EF-Tu-like GTPase